MKKLFAIFTIIIALWVASVTPVYAIETKNCDYLTGGAQRALDYISVNDLNDGDRAFVIHLSGASYYMVYMKFDATGTTAENVSNHPYYVRPDDYNTRGVWYEVLSHFVDLDADLSITNLTVTSLLTVNDVIASGKLSGGKIYHPLYADYTVSGVTLLGGYITGVSEPETQSGITVTFPSATGPNENVFLYNSDNTYDTGNTLYVHFNAADTIVCDQTFTAGTSKFIISGTSPFDNRIVAWSAEAKIWHVLTVGPATVDWD